jgi:hypothetical protein
MKTAVENVKLAAETSSLYVFVSETKTRGFFGVFTTSRQMIRVTDKTGVVRLQRSHAEVISTKVADIARQLESTITKLTDFGDAGRALPDVHILVGARIVNLSGLAEMQQASAIARTELENMPEDEKIVIVAAQKNN